MVSISVPPVAEDDEDDELLLEFELSLLFDDEFPSELVIEPVVIVVNERPLRVNCK